MMQFCTVFESIKYKVTSSGKLMHNHKEDGSFHFLSHLDEDRPIIKLSLQDSLGPNGIRAGLTISSNEMLEEIDSRPSYTF